MHRWKKKQKKFINFTKSSVSVFKNHMFLFSNIAWISNKKKWVRKRIYIFFFKKCSNVVLIDIYIVFQGMNLFHVSSGTFGKENGTKANIYVRFTICFLCVALLSVIKKKVRGWIPNSEGATLVCWISIWCC